MKKIFFAHQFPSMHSQTKLMVANPPEGYIFILKKENFKQKFYNFIIKLKIVKLFYKKLIKQKINTLKAIDYLSSVKIPKEADLVFSTIPLDINQNYIIEILDNPTSMAGYDYNLFNQKLGEIKNKLSSHFCKSIIIVNESSLKIMKKYFSDDKIIMNKIKLIRAAVKIPEINNKKEYSDKIKIIFIGSMANPDDFYTKGGLEAIESFIKASKKINNIYFTLRCKIPEEIKVKYSSIERLNFVEEELPKEDFENLIFNSDIFLCPGHSYSLMALLEPMSYGIPIIALDTYAVRDYITNKNAIIIKPSNKIKGYFSPEYPSNMRSKEFIEDIKNIDERVIKDISDAIIKLSKNNKLRIKMGQEGLKLAKTKFSIELKNKKLKEVFDQVTNSI
ncbi:MAG TPA: glycosyltransferase family 4 protein [Candidatus Paceibacterota bacterium]|nr:glycosyltransferase family 4 protein [Candidatus Paceibacterota bacterium]